MINITPFKGLFLGAFPSSPIYTPFNHTPVVTNTSPPLIVDPMHTAPKLNRSIFWYRLNFGVSTLLLVTVAGLTVVSVVEIDKHHNLTYIANILDLVNAYIGVIYQVFTLIEEYRAEETSFTHLRINIPALSFLFISGLTSVILSTISLAKDHSNNHEYGEHALTDITLSLLITCVICNWIIVVLHLICLVHLIRIYRNHKKISPKSNLGTSVLSLHRQYTLDVEMQSQNRGSSSV